MGLARIHSGHHWRTRLCGYHHTGWTLATVPFWTFARVPFISASARSVNDGSFINSLSVGIVECAITAWASSPTLAKFGHSKCLWNIFSGVPTISPPIGSCRHCIGFNNQRVLPRGSVTDYSRLATCLAPASIEWRRSLSGYGCGTP